MSAKKMTIRRMSQNDGLLQKGGIPANRIPRVSIIATPMDFLWDSWTMSR